MSRTAGRPAHHEYEPRGFPRTRSCSAGAEQLGDCWTTHDPYSDVGEPYVVWIDDVVDTITITINEELAARQLNTSLG